jgi:hypothetical protein
MVSKRILEQWNALKLFFNDQWLVQNVITGEEICNSLNNPIMELYFCFLNWVLPKVAGMNQYFQSDQVLILQVHERMEKEFRELLLTYLRYDYVTSRELSEVNPTNQTYFRHKNSLYLGIKVAEKKEDTSISPEMLDIFLTNCQNFLSTLFTNQK